MSDTIPETIPVENLDRFVQILTAWHSEKCLAVQHMLTIPEGSEFQIGDEETGQTNITLTGDAMAAFKLGVEMVMMELGSLPFVVEMEEDEPVPA